jgi:hypothetical protein
MPPQEYRFPGVVPVWSRAPWMASEILCARRIRDTPITRELRAQRIFPGPGTSPGMGLPACAAGFVCSAGLDVRLAQVIVHRLLRDPERPANLHRGQRTGMHQPVDGHPGNPHGRRHFGDREESNVKLGPVPRLTGTASGSPSHGTPILGPCRPRLPLRRASHTSVLRHGSGQSDRRESGDKINEDPLRPHTTLATLSPCYKGAKDLRQSGTQRGIGEPVRSAPAQGAPTPITGRRTTRTVPITGAGRGRGLERPPCEWR